VGDLEGSHGYGRSLPQRADRGTADHFL
jgi:hypothetical protein